MTKTHSKFAINFDALRNPQVWGKILIVLGILLFALTAISLLTKSLLYAWDTPVSRQFALLRNRATPAEMELVTNLGYLGSQGTTYLALAFMVFFLIRKYYRAFFLMLVGLGGGELVWLPLIFAFNRARPQSVEAFGALGGVSLPSFPSGHTEIIINVFFILLYIYVTGKPSRGWTLAFAAFILIWVVLTGLIRLFLNVHYFTDVLGGYALGLAWTGLTIWLVDGLIFKQKKVSWQ